MNVGPGFLIDFSDLSSIAGATVPVNNCGLFGIVC
jgi:hypothetical protein